MGFQRENALNQSLDIAGSEFQTDNLTLTDESAGFGRAINSGHGTEITVTSSVILTGLSGMTTESEGNFIELSGFSNIQNNGIFLISAYISSSEIQIDNISAISEIATFSFIERMPYSLEDDINYIRTDRALIKGTPFDGYIPTYYRCDDKLIPVPANLFNIAGNTLDAKALIFTRKFGNAFIDIGSTFTTISSIGNLKHSDSINVIGIPVYDGFDFGNYESTYVDIIDGYGSGLFVIDGINAGNRIFGRTRAGTSVSPDSVEIEFLSVMDGESVSNGISYVWENQQPIYIDFYYPYRDCLSSIDENALRVMQIDGLLSNSGIRKNIKDLQLSIGVSDGDQNLSQFITNTESNYAFFNLPNSTPTVVDALNILNEQIGNRTYTGDILTDGYTITESLQEISTYIDQAIIDGYSLPSASEVGQILFSVNGVVFEKALPVTTTEGWLVNDLGYLIVKNY